MEHAIAIARVSSTKQREEDQTPELVRYADGQGYQLDAIVPIHGKSAFHGRHVREVLDAVDRHVRHGGATVVIFREPDRSSRQGVFAGYDLLIKIMAAGARVEFSAMPFLNTTPEILGIYFKTAQAASQEKRVKKLQGNAARAERGLVNGKPAWGYSITGGILVPSDLGRTWIPRIFHAAVSGKSLRAIQDMLTSSAVPAPQGNGVWNEASIRRIIACPTYHGGRVGKGAMQYEALVSVELWQQANMAVQGRVRRGRGTVKREPVLVRPYCGACFGAKRDGAPSGKSPMYRVSKNGYDYYRCRGHGAGRKSCGAKLIPVGQLDGALDFAMAGDTRPYMETRYIPGDDRAERLAGLNEQIAAAARKGDYAAIGELTAMARVVESTPVRRARTEMYDTGRTIGEQWMALKSQADRREFLATRRVEVIAWLVDGNVRVLVNHG